MRFYLKVKLEQAKILVHKASQEIKKLALAIVITEFALAGSFAAIVKYTNLPEISQIQPTQAKITHLNELQALENKKDEADIDQNEKLKDLIWLRESTRGKHNFSKCEAQGKINGIGYSVYGDKYMCFASHDEEMEVLGKWIEKHKRNGLTEIDMLCLYSGGHYQECSK